MNSTTPLVIANFKANKTWEEMNLWLEKIADLPASFKGTVVVCPSAPFLTSTSQKIKALNLEIKLGSQDISQFEQGAFTGEMAASQIANVCQFSIVGHSERRQNFKETYEILEKKVQNANKANIEPIFCIQGDKTPIPDGVQIVAYEPVFAIGTGNPDTPENAQAISQRLRAKGQYAVLYGGSVSGENVKSFLKKDVLEGILVGTKSLDPNEFLKILKNASF